MSSRTLWLRVFLLTLVARLAAVLIITIAKGKLDLASALVQWDAGHYLRIAQVGYRSYGEDRLFIVFFPLFPIAIRIASAIITNRLYAALVVNWVASVVAGVLLFRVVNQDGPKDEAWRAVVALLCFPTAYFMLAPYTEPLFICLVLGCVLLTRRGRFVAAGLVGALAMVTRMPGLALVPMMAVEAFQSGTDRLRRLAASALPLLGLAVYLGINLVVHDDPLAFLEVQRTHWTMASAPPWVPLVAAVRGLASPQGFDFRFIFIGRLAAAAIAIGLLALGVKRLRPGDQAYGWAGTLIVLSTQWLISLPRYILVLYPLFTMQARLARRKAVAWTIGVSGVLLQIWLFSRFVRGRWTF